ncbi:MAG: bifunctional methylenetetrahydrofolate dehydrogenase/methenyltetrahydrofolate cyclohydrolase FolD [Kiritimatiellaeota bacterium]|nr:bifunctional methylenetetrahydrofolate dehydrogenase/methenyltetrahydrofolate cyclohydrolase FolD [Kiritimatiellota bacterium]
MDNRVVLDGVKMAGELRAEVARRVAQLRDDGIVPGLAVILAGENPASVSYVTAKEKACAEAGIASFAHRLPATVSQEEVVSLIRQLNADARVHGILVQLPLPKGMDEAAVLREVIPEKDVDGFHPVNVGKMMLGEPCFLPCTPHGIKVMLERAGVQTAGKHVVVVGRSNIVGKPIANMLVQKPANATVTVCHTGTPDLSVFTRQADILIVAAGRPDTVTADMVKEGVVVIDVGVNRIPDATRPKGFRLVGDTDFAGLSQKASLITPVPGGVGPMTIAMLLANTIQSVLKSNENHETGVKYGT